MSEIADRPWDLTAGYDMDVNGPDFSTERYDAYKRAWRDRERGTAQQKTNPGPVTLILRGEVRLQELKEMLWGGRRG